MTTYAADDANAIALRLKEIEKETQERVSGDIPKAGTPGEYAMDWPMTAAADYDPSAYVFTIPDLRGRVKPT